jgi:hypothetical protein
MRYLLCDYSDGKYDAKKDPDNTDDNLMCWAAAASNILAWSNWGFPSTESFTDANSIFQHFQEHWKGSTGYVDKAWQWWFNSINDPDIYVQGSGGFWNNPYYNFKDFYHYEEDRAKALPAIDQFLHNGWGIALNLILPQGPGHYLTCWGYEHNENNDYVGIYVTDADDTLDSEWRYYKLHQGGWSVNPDWWYFDYYKDQKEYLIDKVHALDKSPSQSNSTPPSPPTGLKVDVK